MDNPNAQLFVYILNKSRCKFFKVYQNLSQCHPFLSFLPSSFLPCKNTFMDDYDGIHNCNSLKYSPLKKITTFDSLFFMGIKI